MLGNVLRFPSEFGVIRASIGACSGRHSTLPEALRILNAAHVWNRPYGQDRPVKRQNRGGGRVAEGAGLLIL